MAYGITPFTISLIVFDLSNPFSTNRFNPTGGEINASSMLMIMIIANQIGSKPSAIMIGYKIGNVITRIETVSRNIPRINSTILIIMKMTQGETSSDVEKFTIDCGICRIVIIKPKSIAPIIMNKIIVFVFTVANIIFFKFSIFKFLYTRAEIRKLSTTPTAAASVGVKRPE